MNIKGTALRIALNTFLSDWDAEADPEETLGTISGAQSWDDLEDVSVWEPFENKSPSEVAESIANLAQDIEEGYAALKG